MSNASRFIVVEKPILAPGSCKICRGCKGPLIDTGMRDPFEGATYVCFDCVKDMFNQFPAAPVEPPPVDTTLEEAKELARVTGFLQGVKEVKDKLDGLTADYFTSLSSVIPNVDFSRYTTGSRIEDVPNDPPGETGSRTSTDHSNKQNVRPVIKQGRLDVPGDSSDGLDQFNIPA